MKIKNEALSKIVHDLIKIASILKTLENNGLSHGEKQILRGCEERLLELREYILQSSEDNGK